MQKSGSNCKPNLHAINLDTDQEDEGDEDDESDGGSSARKMRTALMREVDTLVELVKSAEEDLAASPRM